MLVAQNFSVSILGTQILHECSLNIQPGSVHVLVGPNGSGKSSFALSLLGHPSYNVLSGKILMQGQDITSTPTHLRAQQGMYLAMQHPVELAGVSVLQFLKELCTIQNSASKSMVDFVQQIQPLLSIVGLPESILNRSVNDGFSGGEKKRFELLQMLLIKPKIAILDEIDSGVDIDGLKMITQALVWYRQQNPNASLLLISHYKRILEYLVPDMVHVMMQGRIIHTGSAKLLDEIESKGFQAYAKGS